MKSRITGILFAALLLALNSMAQIKTFDPAAIVAPYHLQITDQKTTVLLFPATIRSVDRGNRGILAEKVKTAENVLKLKAQSQGLPESNLSVITADGKLYTFLVGIVDNPPYQAIDLCTQAIREKAVVALKETQLNEAEIRATTAKIADQKGFMRKSEKSSKMKITLEGIYSYRDVIFYQLRVQNKSHMDYHIDFNRFYVRDNKRVKRMAIQETELLPVYTLSDSSGTVPGNNTRELVFAFKQFTIADNKHLSVELNEQNGDRHLSLSVSGKDILKAQPISQ